MDGRTRRQKLAAMAAQSVSPAEAEVARRKLADLPTPTTLTRDAILAQPDLRAGIGSRRVYDRVWGVWVVVDEDDSAFAAPDLEWDGVE